MDVFPVKASNGTDTHSDCRLIVQDGASTIYRWDPEQETGVVLASFDGEPEELSPRSWQIDGWAVKTQHRPEGDGRLGSWDPEGENTRVTG